MQVSVEQLPESRVQFRVEVPPDEVRPFLASAARELSKEHPPKGFRPGAAPFEVMRSVVGDEKIAERAVKALVRKTYVEIVLGREDIEAIGSPTVEVEASAFDKPWVYRATVTVLPEVTLGNYRGVRGERRTVLVETAEVERELDVLRKMRAGYLTVLRPAQKGDRVEVDIVGFVDRVPLDPGPQRRQPILLGESRLIPGFEENLVGMNEGETKTFSVAFPEHHHHQGSRIPDSAGKTVEFTVMMGTIQQRILPALDDAFAKGIGNFQSLADLNERLTANIREEKEHRERERHQQDLLDRVVAISAFGEFPEILLERELETMLAELRAGVQALGIPFEAYLAQIKKTASDVRAGLRSQAHSRVRAGLVLRAIAKSERIEVTEEEVVSEVNETVQNFSSPQEAEKRVDPDAARDVAAAAVRNRRVLTLLEQIAAHA